MNPGKVSGASPVSNYYAKLKLGADTDCTLTSLVNTLNLCSVTNLVDDPKNPTRTPNAAYFCTKTNQGINQESNTHNIQFTIIKHNITTHH